ncbi:hypothetical protein Leryth_018336 [Lithospermum erythrorhizon]|nr:hypothetical protein Leryth_018336 [Lithospermum erythrorhizon]
MPDSSESSAPLLNNHHQDEHYSKPSNDELIEPYLSGIRWPQVLNAMLGFLPSFFAAQVTFVTIFTDSKPSWHCMQESPICNSSSNICQLQENAWSWDKPAQTSIVSEWFLDCASNAIVEGLPASSFFIGSLVAGFCLSFIGDQFGRKKLLFVSSLIMSGASFFAAFSNNVWLYSAMRFVSGLGRAAIGTCALVLATESVGKKWQGKLGSVGFLVFTLGFLILPLMAFLVRDSSWRVIYLMISIPGILYCIALQLFAYESPRWLLTQGRVKEAVEVLKAFAGPDSKDLSWNFNLENRHQKVKKGNSMLSFFRILSESRALSRQLILLLIISFGIGLVYYGAALGVGSLGFDLYWGAAFNAVLQVISFFVVYVSITKLKRKISLLGLAFLSGVCCISIPLCTMFGLHFQVVLELLSFFSASTAFSITLIYTAELFPTEARNSAVAIVWQALMLGGVVSPVMIAAGGDSNILSFGLFGVCIIATGSLVLFLPETIGVVSSAGTNNGEQDGNGEAIA